MGGAGRVSDSRSYGAMVQVVAPKCRGTKTSASLGLCPL